MASMSQSVMRTRYSMLRPERFGEMDGMYRPLVERWLRGRGFNAEAVDDITQRVMIRVWEKLHTFSPDGKHRSFRRWLATVTTRCISNYFREKLGKKTPEESTGAPRAKAVGGSEFRDVVAGMRDPQSLLRQEWDRQHDEHVLGVLLATIEEQIRREAWQVHPLTYEAFRRVALLEESVADVAEDLGMSPGGVRLARYRVLARLREVGRELFEDSQFDVEMPRRDPGQARTPRPR